MNMQILQEIINLLVCGVVGIVDSLKNFSILFCEELAETSYVNLNERGVK